ncbi:MULTISPECIES: pantoate--beta-alanine ligase [Calditerrivibrio]|jgi:pantoate--beta-alanine ligase|uniref:pantoate--beta-alanine ligase n=1 Tax=Calditerrivibrio TaxID=545865 RepID=UPI003C714153
MEIIREIKKMKDYIAEKSKKGYRIGFVPTMGYLHDGHLSLVRRSKKDNDITVVSIFVNPTQFGPNEDLDRYPRDFDRDENLLRNESVDVIFYPDLKEIYPDNYMTYVNVEKITDRLCGIKRPGHFRGVATIVCKLFNIVKPDRAYFGLKDYQQVLVIKKMVEDLNMDVDIVPMPIVREEDGLAMSSRNVYLSKEERESALSLNRSFALVEELLKNGVRNSKTIKDKVSDFILGHPYTKIDYVEIMDPDNLDYVEDITGNFLLALAVFINKTRLIDNKIFEV